MSKGFLIFLCLLVHRPAFSGLVWKTRTITTVSIPGELEAQLKSLPEEVKSQMGAMLESKAETTYQTTYLEKGLVKLVDQETGEITIIRGDKGVIWNINPSRKTYTEMTIEDLKNLMEYGAEKMDSLGISSPAYKFTPTNETKKILGYTCNKVIFTVPMVGECEHWITNAIDTREYTAGFEKMIEIGKQFTPSYLELKGFPLLTKMGGVISEVIEIAEKKLLAGEFALPSGLTKELSEYKLKE